MKPPSQPPDLPDHNPGALKCIIGVLADILSHLKTEVKARVWQQGMFSRTLSVVLTSEES